MSRASSTAQKALKLSHPRASQLHPDLFGGETRIVNEEPGVGPPRQKKSPYAAAPGSGPEGERCRSCALATAHDHHDRRYWKCGLVKPTHGAGTDIRLRSPACRFWKPKETMT